MWKHFPLHNFFENSFWMHRKQNITPIERPTKIIGYLYYLWYTYHLCTFKVICNTKLYMIAKKKKKKLSKIVHQANIILFHILVRTLPDLSFIYLGTNVSCRCQRSFPPGGSPGSALGLEMGMIRDTEPPVCRIWHSITVSPAPGQLLQAHTLHFEDNALRFWSERSEEGREGG